MLCFGGDASVRAGIGRLAAGVRPAAGRLVDRRTDGRADFGVAVRGLETVDFGLAVVALGFAAVDLAAVLDLAVLLLAVLLRAVVLPAVVLPDVLLPAVLLPAVLLLDVLLPAVLLLAVVLLAVVLLPAVRALLVLGRVVEALGFAAVLDLAAVRVVEDRRAAGRRAVVAAGLAVDIVLAAAVSALAAAVMDFVAVFIARIADDIV